MKDTNKNIPIRPEIEVDLGYYTCCPACGHIDLEPTDIITRCPCCEQSIDWSWMRMFKDTENSK